MGSAIYYGCSGCSCICSGCSCLGSVVVAPPVIAQAPPPLPARIAPPPRAVPPQAGGLTPEEVDVLRRFMRNMANKEEKKAERKPPKDEAGAQPAATSDVARISVKLPADARLWVDHVECPLTTSLRAFNTPSLEPNQTYAYTLKVEVQRDGQTLSERQRVLVNAGRRVDVDFTRMTSVATAQR